MGRDLISQMLSHTHNIILSAEIAANSGIAEALRKLRGLCLDDFGEFMLELPAADIPNLSSVLPRMASEEVQKDWTGKSGPGLFAADDVFHKIGLHITTINYWVSTWPSERS